jgi:glycosyltransferase involved in cell wall biosynthesis
MAQGTQHKAARAARGEPPSYVFVLTWPPTGAGGVNEVVFALAHQINSLGFRPLIAVATWSHQEHVESCRGVEVINLRLRDLSGCGFGWKQIAAFVVSALPDALALRRFVRERNVRALNVHFASAAALLPAMMRSVGALGTPLMISFHGSDIAELNQSRGLARHVWRFVLKHCDVVTAPSDALLRQIRKFAPTARAVRVYNGVDQNLFDIQRKKNSRRPVILQVGKFDSNKAQDITLRALRILLNERLSADLILAGASGSALEDVRALTRELHLEQNVQVCLDLPHDAVPPLMAQADVLVLPSRNESFGLVLLEAGVVGVPVIATRVGGIPELIRNEETGLLIVPESSGELAAAIRRILSDEAFAEQIASRWHEEVLRRFTWERTAQAYLSALGLVPSLNSTSV